LASVFVGRDGLVKEALARAAGLVEDPERVDQPDVSDLLARVDRHLLHPIDAERA